MRQIILILFSFFIFDKINAQLEGLWEVKRVTVGEEVMTPVAKWFDLKDGRVYSGNGGLRNTLGTYTFDPQIQSILFLVL